MENSNKQNEDITDPTTNPGENPTNQTENETKSTESEPMVQSPAPLKSDEDQTKSADSNLITLTVKTPKEKENVILKADATVKDVRKI